MAKKDSTEQETKEYTLTGILRLGSNKDGSAKKEYKPGDKIKLSEERAKKLLKQKIIE